MSNCLVRRLISGLLSSIVLMLLTGQLSVPAFPQAQPQPALEAKNVLILHSHEANAPVFIGTDEGLSATLESGGIFSFHQFFESLELRRNPSAEHRKLLVEQMRVRYGHRKLDVIITMFPEALEFVLKDGRNIFPDVPILALYLPEGFELPKTDRSIIGHSAKPDIIGTFELALKLVRGAKRVYVVSGVHEVDRMIEDRARRELKKWETRLEFHYLSSMPFRDMLATISTAPPDSIILALVLSRDVIGTSYTSPTVTQQLSQVSTAPIFGLLDAALGYGITGGSLINFKHIGSKAGELVLDILKGIPTLNNIPEFLDVPGVPMFDWQQLKRWNLSVSALPKGSVVINREHTLWDFRYYIIGGIAVFLAQTFLLIGLFIQRRRKIVAEDSLQQKTEELDQFFNVSLDLLCIANTEGDFLRLNPTAERILGYMREELMAKRFLDFVHPDDLDRTRKAISALASQQKVFSFENRYRCKDGTYRWLEWNSAPAGKLIYAAARDVTDRKLANEALKKSEESYRMLVETMTEGLAVEDESGQFTYVNDRLCEMLGYFQGEIIGRPVTEFLDEANQSISRERFQKQRKGDSSPYEIVWTRRDGRKMATLVSPKSIFDTKGQFRGSFAVITDITERKQAEEASQESQRVLRQNENDLRSLAGRLMYAQEEERSRLARELHDDLAQRLAVFAINVGRLEQQWVDPPASAQEKLREIKNDIIKISQDIHNLSRQLHPSILDDLGLIKAVESECINFSRREGIDVAFNHENIPTGIPKDVSLSLYRIIQEGLRNISKHACADHISVSLRGIDREVLLSVQDDGIGFNSSEVKEKPGLGFSSMRERARLIHGELSIQSEPEKGTLITLRVPLMKEG